MYLTTFLWEEAKHVDCFQTFLREVTGDPGDLSRYYNPSYQEIFGDVLPQAVANLKRDESRHIAFGVYFLSRLIIEHGDRAWQAFERSMAELEPVTDRQIAEFITFFEGGHPFGVAPEELMAFSEQQSQARMQRIGKARGQRLEELHRVGSVYREDAA